jgi:putative DNA primase/helicase
MVANYAAVLLQLQNFGLIVASLEPGRIMRCKVDGDREKRGWYILHEITLSGGDVVLVGSFGIWHGAENNVQKVELNKIDLSPEQKAAIKARMAEDKKRADAEQRRRSDRAAAAADKVWHKLAEDGISEYLTRKGVTAFGVRFTPTGAVAVPMLDTAGRLHGLQFILDKFRHKEKIKAQGGRDKQFWPPGVAKKSHFHLIGSPTTLLAIGEGYATCASYHMATGFPVAVAFDAGNLQSVAQALKKRYPKARILIIGDDDALARCKHCQTPLNLDTGTDCPACNEPHGRKNAGAEYAELAALAVDGRFILPRFADPPARLDHYARNQGKLTDFNDLHLTDGLHSVRVQVEDAIARFGWAALVAAGAASRKGGGDSKTLKPIDTADELLERFALVYGMGGTVFDHAEHLLVTLSDMRDACMSREIHRRWQESPTRSIVRVENVGFDPAGIDANITCNLWAGWPTVPKAGQCDQLLALLYHMCSGEQNSLDLAKWVIKWLAYPLQHPGAKMRTTLVLHGPQGTGKNLFFEAIMAIYGGYGRVIDQSAIEDKFNDWASRKLFLIADEVVARSDLYHIKNKLKSFISGVWVRINPKNMAAHEERNHVNLVFLSNERMPVVIEEDDRRHCVIWTPPKKEAEFYKAVGAEIDAGGIEALHDWLLNIILDDFDEHAKPPMTQAKEELLHLGKDSILRFYDEWIAGDLDGIPNLPALSEDVYELYRYWCGKQGVRQAPMNRAIDALTKRPGMRKDRKWFLINGKKSSSAKAFLFPPGCQEMNPGNSESYWLGDCVNDFRAALGNYKGRSYGD